MNNHWEPIETAPREFDGTRIIGWHCEWWSWMALRWKTHPKTGVSYWGDPKPGEWGDNDLYDKQPTHWLPIETPPKWGKG